MVQWIHPRVEQLCVNLNLKSGFKICVIILEVVADVIMLQSLQWLGTQPSRGEGPGVIIMTRDCSYPGPGTRPAVMQRFISSSHSGDMSGAGGQAGTSFRCSHCQDGKVVPGPSAPPKPLPTLIIEEIKNRVLGSPLPSRLVWLLQSVREALCVLFRSDTDSVCIELMPLGSQLDTQAALRRKKSKVRLSLLSLSHCPLTQPL